MEKFSLLEIGQIIEMQIISKTDIRMDNIARKMIITSMKMEI